MLNGINSEERENYYGAENVHEKKEEIKPEHLVGPVRVEKTMVLQVKERMRPRLRK